MAKAVKKTVAKSSEKEETEEKKSEEKTLETTPEKNETKLKELETQSKKLKKNIESIEERLSRENQKCKEWLSEGNELLEKAEQKFEDDKIKKILQLKEEDNIEALDVLINYHQAQIYRLSSIKQEKVDAGDDGDFSDEYKKYLAKRSERYEKRKSNLNKWWIKYTENYTIRKIKPLEEKLLNLKKEWSDIENEIAKNEK